MNKTRLKKLKIEFQKRVGHMPKPMSQLGEIVLKGGVSRLSYSPSEVRQLKKSIQPRRAVW